jgi:hypothetical protein
MIEMRVLFREMKDQFRFRHGALVTLRLKMLEGNRPQMLNP